MFVVLSPIYYNLRHLNVLFSGLSLLDNWRLLDSVNSRLIRLLLCRRIAFQIYERVSVHFDIGFWLSRDVCITIRSWQNGLWRCLWRFFARCLPLGPNWLNWTRLTNLLLSHRSRSRIDWSRSHVGTDVFLSWFQLLFH